MHPITVRRVKGRVEILRRKVKLLFTAACKILPDLDTRENASWRAGKGHTWPLPLGVQAFFQIYRKEKPETE